MVGNLEGHPCLQRRGSLHQGQLQPRGDLCRHRGPGGQQRRRRDHSQQVRGHLLCYSMEDDEHLLDERLHSWVMRQPAA